jgi:hypothetical protein
MKFQDTTPAIHQDTLGILHTLGATPGDTLQATLGIPVVMLAVIPTHSILAILAILSIHQAILAILVVMDIPMEVIMDISCLAMFIVI